MRWIAVLVLASSVACSESSLPTQPTPGPVTPPLITFAGVISESETNTPLAGVSVCWPVQNCTLTGPDGSYQFTAASPVDPRAYSTHVYPFAVRDGFEIRGARVPVIGNRVSWSVTLQRTITLDAGRNVRSTVFKGEGNGLAEDSGCEPCKSFNVLVPGSGTLFLSVEPDSPESRPRVEVFYEGFDNGALQITTERSVQVIVHAAVAPASFELITSFKR
jgi:hypothetical protein